jgi:meso-butanediol dehydrogenase / (S,S)-butanediol dehydrogenase / diacetyl reductase
MGSGNGGLVSDQVVIVTGAAAGIGRAIALELAHEGASVVAADVDRDGLVETQRLAGGELSLTVADVSEPAEVESLVAETVRDHGRLTAMVNNAGISIPNDVVSASVDEFERTIAVNVRGPFLGCKFAIPEIIAAGGGSIVNVGSINSVVAEPQLTTYCTSKGAVLMLTKSVALDMATRHVRCNCICPGFVDTQINEPHSERLTDLKLDESLESFQPIGRAIEPREIARTAVFLVSDASTAITGAAIMVDGGVTAKA